MPVIEIAIKSATGAAQKILSTPRKTGAISEKAISKTSRKIDNGTAAFTYPIDCKKIAQTFCTQVNRISES